MVNLLLGFPPARHDNAFAVIQFLALLSLAPLFAQDESLLAPLPEGWRREHLEFPLEFAPDIEYRGFEDLGFAPGMFDPKSDSYFSYALALRLEGDVEVDERTLTRFLESYYQGLCRAVVEGRGFDRDASTVRASVRREGADFRANVEMFDPFVTGDPLTLQLDLSTHAAPRATEVLGLASPLPQDASIWGELRAIAEAWRERRPAPVFLNHLYVVVDRETYDALAGSDLLRETIAVSEERTTKRADLSYTGLYFYGGRTYFEFLAPQAAAGLVEGGTGIAFGLETEGSIDGFASRLEERKVKTQLAPITRELEGAQVPWFRILGVEMPPSPLNVFAMEYEPRFLASWHASLPPAGAATTRAAVLERYAAALGRSELRASAPFGDVREVRLALADAQRERLLAVCEAAGFEIEAGEASWTCFGPQFRLAIERSEKSGGVTGFELALRKGYTHEPLRLGRVTIEFGAGTASFSLRP